MQGKCSPNLNQIIDTVQDISKKLETKLALENSLRLCCSVIWPFDFTSNIFRMKVSRIL